MTKTLSGVLLEDHLELSLNDLCQACSRPAEWVIELVEYGAIEPIGEEQINWRFNVDSLQRARTAMRLQRDLDINLAGIALALDLLDEIKRLRTDLHINGSYLT